MQRVIVRYRVKPERAAENREYIEKVFAELNQTNPAGLRYATFRGSDGLTHFHVASIETEDGDNPLMHSPAFAAFSASIRDRCDEPPVVMDVEEIGSYRFL
jgi:quinol monooxygenase YgiN